MKNINYVINGVLAVAVVILYIMQFSGKKDFQRREIQTRKIQKNDQHSIS